MRLFPLGDGLGFIAVHLFVHARAVFARDGRCCAGLTLIVVDALIDPLDVVGIHLLRRRRNDGRGQCEDRSGQNRFHS